MALAMAAMRQRTILRAFFPSDGRESLDGEDEDGEPSDISLQMRDLPALPKTNELS